MQGSIVKMQDSNKDEKKKILEEYDSIKEETRKLQEAQQKQQ